MASKSLIIVVGIVGDLYASSRVCAASLDTSDISVQNEILGTHNDLRRKISTTGSFNLTWDAELAQKALDWALTCNESPHPDPDNANQVQYTQTSQFTQIGQNMAGNSAYSWSKVITNQWYAEIKDFVYDQDPSPKEVGHYTQVVWGKTYKVGCAQTVCSDSHIYFCDYGPGGNIKPNQFSPYNEGASCADCPNNCDRGLCTNPCPVQNEYTNCDTELFPNGCDNAPDYLQDFLVYCKATCQCKGQLLY